MSGVRDRLRRRRRSGAKTAGEPEAPGSEGGKSKVVLYRCPTPTNVLCPCGAVERRLKKLGIDHRIERVPYKRKQRPEIQELTAQQRVPMLIDGAEIIHDSKRILEYLDWRYGDERTDAEPDSGDEREGSEQSA